MAFMAVMGPCLACKAVFSFNATYVPSFKGEPVCESCMKRVNAKRKEMGLPPHPIHPKAYTAEEVA